MRSGEGGGAASTHHGGGVPGWILPPLDDPLEKEAARRGVPTARSACAKGVICGGVGTLATRSPRTSPGAGAPSREEGGCRPVEEEGACWPVGVGRRTSTRRRERGGREKVREQRLGWRAGVECMVWCLFIWIFVVQALLELVVVA